MVKLKRYSVFHFLSFLLLFSFVGSNSFALPKRVDCSAALLKDPSDPSKSPSARPRKLPRNTHTNKNTTADKIEIMGRTVELLESAWRYHGKIPFFHYPNFLSYAENTDEQSSATIFRKLHDETLTEKDIWGIIQIKIGFAISLLKAGYKAEGERMLKEEVAKIPGYARSEKYFNTHQVVSSDQIGNLFSIGRADLVELVFDTMQTVFEPVLSQLRRLKGAYDYKMAHQIRESFHFWLEVTDKIEELPKEKHSSKLKNKLFLAFNDMWRQVALKFASDIVEYRKKLGVPSEAVETLDELTGIKPLPQTGPMSMRSSDQVHLIGHSTGNGLVMPFYFLRQILDRPILFEMAADIVVSLPESQAKLALFEHAVAKAPPSFSDSKRLKIGKEYRASLLKLERALRLRGFDERYEDYIEKTVPRTEKDRDFSTTQLFWRHTTQLARLYFEGSSSLLKQKGFDELDRLSASEKQFQNLFRLFLPNFSLFDGELIRFLEFTEFRPQIFRIFSQLSVFHELSPEKRKAVLADAASLLRPDQTNYDELKYRLWAKAVKLAVRFGYNQEAQNLSGFGRDFSDKIQRIKIQTSVEGLASLAGGKFEEFLDRVESDVRQKRKRFSYLGLIDLINFFADSPELNPYPSASTLERLALIGVDYSIQVYGTQIEHTDDLFNALEHWNSLVNALKRMEIPSLSKDQIFVHLIEKTTPESSLVQSNAATAGGTSRWQWYDAYKAMDFVLGNVRLPESDKLLHEKLAKSVHEIKFEPTTQDFFKNMGGLAWAYQRVRTAEIFDHHKLAEYSALRDSPEYRRALEHLFWNEDRGSSTKNVHQEYSEAVAARNIKELSNLEDDVSKVSKTEIDIVLRAVKSEWDLYDSRIARVGLLDAVATDFERAKKQNDDELAESLLKLLLANHDEEQAKQKCLLYFEYLNDASVKRTWKRMIFQQLQRTSMVSTYVSRRWKQITDSNDDEREDLLYAALTPFMKGGGGYRYTVSLPPDELVGLAIELPLEESKEYVSTYLRHLDVRSHLQTHIEPLNEFSWHIHVAILPRRLGRDLWSGSIASIFEALLLLKHGVPPDFYRVRDDRSVGKVIAESPRIKADIAKFFPEYESLIAWKNGSHTFFDYHSLDGILGYMASKPKAEELDLALPKFRRVVDRHEKIKDLIQITNFDMPDLFKDRDLLTQFLVTRYFFQMPVGEQQELLSILKESSKDSALKDFFEKTHLEKIGQFLSVWPEVPEQIQRELSFLQTEVPPSDISEIRETIEKELAGNPELDSILLHLSAKPRGSGTIAEVYDSQLRDGSYVVVKVIPPSKERVFRVGLERITKVRDLLRLYREEITGAFQTDRFIEMYLSMVEKEFNLLNEAAAASRYQANNPHTVKVPRYYTALSTSRVAVIQRVVGKPISAIGSSEKAKQMLLGVFGNLLMERVTQHRFYHSDPQPGNFMIDNDGILWLLDFGQMGEPTEEEVTNLLELLPALDSTKTDELLVVLEKMCDLPRIYGEDQRRQLNTDLMTIKVFDRKSAGVNVSPVLKILLKILGKNGLAMKPPYLQLLKTFSGWEGTIKAVE